MDAEGWNRRYATTELVWSAEPNRFLVEQDPGVLFTPDAVVADLSGTGLQVERAERVQRTVTTDDGPRIAIDALGRAHRPDSPDA